MRPLYFYLVLAVTLSAAIGALIFSYVEYQSLMSTLSSTTEQLASSTDRSQILARKTVELSSALAREQARNGDFTSQIDSLASTVGVLDKLAKTDKELLAKYSKVYFLSEHFIPTALTEVPAPYRYPQEKIVQVHARIEPYLTSLLEEAAQDNVDIRVASGYRSFSSQGALKNAYTVTYGKGANAFSADQGYSEHQLGTTFDFTTTQTNGALVGFDTTAGYTWLTEHAHEYGFVLSYPKGNTYYRYEPWHWRFVGIQLATRLHQDNEYFYDLEQREIDTYLVSLFDK